MNELNVPRMATVAETAKILHLPECLVRSKAAAGEFVSIRSGRRILINVDKAIEYLNIGDTPCQPFAAKNGGVMPIAVKGVRAVHGR